MHLGPILLTDMLALINDQSPSKGHTSISKGHNKSGSPMTSPPTSCPPPVFGTHLPPILRRRSDIEKTDISRPSHVHTALICDYPVFICLLFFLLLLFLFFPILNVDLRDKADNCPPQPPSWCAISCLFFILSQPFGIGIKIDPVTSTRRI